MQENVYRLAYMDCVRAIEFLLSRREIDSTAIGLYGGSQGGGLAIATAGLLPDYIRAVAFFDPFPSDTRDHMRIRTLVSDELEVFASYYGDCNVDKILGVFDYADVRGLASRIKCPVFFVSGLFDDDMTPHTGFAAFNMIKAPKEYKIYPHDGHLGDSGEYQDMIKFLNSELKRD